jgi:hypothetical protein
MTYAPGVSEAEEVVDGVPVLREDPPPPVVQRPAAAPVAVQAAAVAGASFVAGAGVIALLKSRSARKSALRLARGRRKGNKLEVLGTRTFLVDVHMVERR